MRVSIRWVDRSCPDVAASVLLGVDHSLQRFRIRCSQMHVATDMPYVTQIISSLTVHVSVARRGSEIATDRSGFSRPPRATGRFSTKGNTCLSKMVENIISRYLPLHPIGCCVRGGIPETAAPRVSADRIANGRVVIKVPKGRLQGRSHWLLIRITSDSTLERSYLPCAIRARIIEIVRADPTFCAFLSALDAAAASTHRAANRHERFPLTTSRSAVGLNFHSMANLRGNSATCGPALSTAGTLRDP
jgi:hypothetical protein